MSKISFWVSDKLANEILLVCGNSAPTIKHHHFILNLLSHMIVNPTADNIHLLSERERTCLFWIAHGMTVKEMTHLMHVKPCTVQTYRRRILTKLNCKTLTQAVFSTMCYQPINHFLMQHFLEK